MGRVRVRKTDPFAKTGRVRVDPENPEMTRNDPKNQVARVCPLAPPPQLPNFPAAPPARLPRLPRGPPALATRVASHLVQRRVASRSTFTSSQVTGCFASRCVPHQKLFWILHSFLSFLPGVLLFWVRFRQTNWRVREEQELSSFRTFWGDEGAPTPVPAPALVPALVPALAPAADPAPAPTFHSHYYKMLIKRFDQLETHLDKRFD
ncbi:hypothetical protein M5K25_021142 [Dendrobium thyrsiflorum]|uniref:Uncharacterized protein n=1 Tax=Dendrobium thyrsiflorum TaxID=117978 RepID=A0ABD0UCH3_DENTH